MIQDTCSIDTASIESKIISLMIKEKWNEAKQLLLNSIATENHSQDPSAYYMLAYCEAQLEEWQEAKEHTLVAWKYCKDDTIANGLQELWNEIWDKP